MSFASSSDIDKNERKKEKEYKSGKFMIMCHGPKKNFYKKFLF